MISIAHIVNPVIVPPTSRFYFIQNVTFASMRNAKALAKDVLEINQYSAQFDEDHPMIPAGFRVTEDLTRSVQDMGNFPNERKLPLIQDILNRLYESSEADYFIYTNADIGLLPHFYQFIATDVINQDYDAVTINRRTISNSYIALEQLPLMYAEIGEPHRGWDCFVFRKNLFPKFILGEVCLGTPLVGLTMIANMIAWSKKFRQIKDKHLTFHLGNDRIWKGTNLLAAYNKEKTSMVLNQIDKIIDGFPPKSPPGIFLSNQRNRVRGFLYELTRSFYIPVKWTRRVK